MLRFMQRMRLLMLTAFGSLSRDRGLISERMSRIVVHDRSQTSNGSDTDFSDNQGEEEIMKAAGRLMTSGKKEDMRLIKIYKG